MTPRARRTLQAALLALVLAATGGCAATVRPWDRDLLAEKKMRFIPSPMEKVTEYAPTAPELLISLGVYAIGGFIVTVLYKIAVGVREDLAA